MALTRAKAEAAKAKLEFAELEANLKRKQAELIEQENLTKAKAVRQKAELEADLELLSHQKEAAAAEAEAGVLETFEVNDMASQGSLFETANNGSSIDHVQRIQAYIQQQSEHNAQLLSSHGHLELANETQDMSPYHKPHIFPPIKPDLSPSLNPTRGPANQAAPSPLNANAPAFHPNLSGDLGTYEANQAKDSSTVPNEFAKFLLKKDLLLSRLTAFSDRPEVYAVWKNSFRGIMLELNCSPTEELDLLVKWLGTESKKYASSIRASNANQPARGLKRLWERLDERYGCPEMIEDALKSKLASFPKLTVKDCKKLYELADILSEIESAKEDSTYAPLLSYYDTSSGIRPIIQKLPHQLQEKWTTRAVRYKDKHKVSFPPFSEFAEFIREMSRVKNDPGFMYENTVSCSQSNRDRSDRNAPVRPVISARKTEIASNATNNTGLDKLCPLHKTRHPLSQCKGFKFKPMEERRKFLKEKKICFRCLETDQHVKKTCKANVRCEDCGSSNHVSAMHVDSSTPVKTVTPSQSPPAADYGGESSPLLVSSKCIQVCHKTFGGKSCAKTLLVTVFPRGRPEEGKRMYV